MWQLIDNTHGVRSGYLSILRDGVRVCDAFPFSAPHTKEHQQFVREQAHRIVDAMNKIDMKPSIISQLSDDPPAQIPDGYRAPMDDRSTIEMMADRDAAVQQQASTEKPRG